MSGRKTVYLLLSDVTPNRATVEAIDADEDALSDVSTDLQVVAALDGETTPEVGDRVRWGYEGAGSRRIAWVVRT